MAELSNKLKVFLARELQRQFTSNDNSVALFIGQTTTDVSSTQSIDNETATRRQIQTAKILTDSKVALMIPRVNWTLNAIYDDYDTSEDMVTKNFYVYTTEGNVYICLSNGGGRKSLEEPKGTGTNPIYLSNGYVWKFMYKIPSELIDFIDTNWIPIQELPTYEGKPYAYADESQLQYAVQYNAVGGRIEQIKVSSTGNAFPYYVPVSAGHKVVQSTTTTVKLDPRASGSDDVYNQYSIRITSGTGAGQIRVISDYTGTNKTATITEAWAELPDTTSIYEILPSIVITGDGVNASAYAKMSAYGVRTINSVVMINYGSNYTTASVSTTPALGTDPVLVPLVSPSAGVGAEPLFDLFTRRMSILVKFEGTEDERAVLGNDYRQFGLWLSPKIGTGYANSGKIAGTESYLRTVVDLTKIAGTTFDDNWVTAGEFLFGKDSYNTGKVADITNPFIKVSSTRARVYLDGLESPFKNGENIYTFTTDPVTGGYTFTQKTAVVANTLFDDSVRSSFTETYRCSHKLTIARTDGNSFDVGTPYGNIPYDAAATGASGSYGNVLDFFAFGGSAGNLYLTNVIYGSSADIVGFTGGETLGIWDGSNILSLNILKVYPPELNLFSGNLLYISNIEQVTRNTEQLDLFKINFDF